MGTVNRDLVVASNSAAKHAAELVAILERAAPRRAAVDAPLQELARMVRLYHRADVQAFLLHVETGRLAARVHELEVQLGQARDAAARTEAEARDARDAAARSEAEVREARDAAARTEAEAREARDAAARTEAEAREARDAAALAKEDALEARNRLLQIKATRRWRFAETALGPADRLRSRLRGRSER
jgi:chromosome segregation ATPase